MDDIEDTIDGIVKSETGTQGEVGTNVCPPESKYSAETDAILVGKGGVRNRKLHRRWLVMMSNNNLPNTKALKLETISSSKYFRSTKLLSVDPTKKGTA